jgi:hypothetical protein
MKRYKKLILWWNGHVARTWRLHFLTATSMKMVCDGNSRLPETPVVMPENCEALKSHHKKKTCQGNRSPCKDVNTELPACDTGVRTTHPQKYELIFARKMRQSEEALQQDRGSVLDARTTTVPDRWQATQDAITALSRFWGGRGDGSVYRYKHRYNKYTIQRIISRTATHSTVLNFKYQQLRSS